MMHQGYDVIFAERFRFPPYYQATKHQAPATDFKRIFLKRRQWSSTPGLITEGGLHLGGTGKAARPISAIGGLHLASTATITRPYASAGGLHLAGNARVTRRYTATGGLHLHGTASHTGGVGPP